MTRYRTVYNTTTSNVLTATQRNELNTLFDLVGSSRDDFLLAHVRCVPDCHGCWHRFRQLPKRRLSRICDKCELRCFRHPRHSPGCHCSSHHCFRGGTAAFESLEFVQHSPDNPQHVAREPLPDVRARSSQRHLSASSLTFSCVRTGTPPFRTTLCGRTCPSTATRACSCRPLTRRASTGPAARRPLCWPDTRPTGAPCCCAGTRVSSSRCTGRRPPLTCCGPTLGR